MTSLDHLENRTVGVVARLAPWLAPVPTAYLVFARTVQHLAWPWPVALAAAIVVEALGLVIAVTGLELYGYNRTRRKSDPVAPLGLPVALLAVYLLAAELLTVGLDVVPKWGRLTLVDWIPAVFPVLSLAGMAVIAVRIDHRRRLESIEHSKAEARRERIERRSSAAAAPALEGQRGPAPQPVPQASVASAASAAGSSPVRCGFDGCDWIALWPSADHADERSAKAARSGHMRWCAHRNGHSQPVARQASEASRP